MTREYFDQLLASCNFPVSLAIDQDTYLCVPNIYGCIEYNGKWLVYRTDYRGDIANEVEFCSEETALDYFAVKLGIVSAQSKCQETHPLVSQPKTKYRVPRGMRQQIRNNIELPAAARVRAPAIKGKQKTKEPLTTKPLATSKSCAKSNKMPLRKITAPPDSTSLGAVATLPKNQEKKSSSSIY